MPESVFINWLSRISLRNWTCGVISEPYAAVAIRQPPPLFCIATIVHLPSISFVPSPHSPNSGSSIIGSSNPTASLIEKYS